MPQAGRQELGSASCFRKHHLVGVMLSVGLDFKAHNAQHVAEVRR